MTIHTITDLSLWVDQARESTNTNRLSVSERKRHLKALIAAIEQQESQLLAALFCDLGKSASEAYLTEVMPILQEARKVIKYLARWAKSRRGSFSLLHFGSQARIIAEPYGVVIIMAPWNYPLNLVLCPLIAALSAGNAVLLSPSPSAPRTHKAIRDLIETCLPSDRVAVVAESLASSGSLLELRYDYIFYTGGSDYARKLMHAAAQHLTPLTLELGGKSPCIVGPEADLPLASRRIAWGKTINAGQTCVAPDFLLVHRSVEVQLMKLLARDFERFYGIDPFSSSSYARMVRPDAARRMKDLMKGGEILYGGEVKLEFRYVAPTVIRPHSPRRALMQQEIFGPILPIVTYEYLEEAIAYVNERPKPLALYYFGSKQNMTKILASTSSGGAAHNDVVMQISHPDLPFGGIGFSGMGRYHGRAGFDTFTHQRSVLYASRWIDLPLRYPPYKPLNALKRWLHWAGL